MHLAKGGIWRVARSVSASSARYNGADERLVSAGPMVDPVAVEIS